MRCTARHKTTDPALGTPLCLDCYDHHGQVVWNHEAPELWRRTIQEADRELGRLGKRLGVTLRRRYFKVNEFQARGVIHYHAVIRLDGYHPDCPTAIVPADRTVTRTMFDNVLRHAFTRTAYTRSGNVFMVKKWVVVHGRDYPKALALAATVRGDEP